MMLDSAPCHEEHAAFPDEEHGQWKARALELARSVLGRTSPNPAVGAVVVRDGQIVGEGATQPAGGAHAEVVALAVAGAAARGGTLYATLEPCSHHGRTPPCTEAIIAAGITRVHYAVLDPNPVVWGNGRRVLEEAGIDVVPGEGTWTGEASTLNEAFFHWIRRQRPFVIAKWAMSLDGRVATRTGDSRWISGDRSRARVHELRNVVDAILVGSGTVLADDPALTTRLGRTDAHHPLRVILDARGRTPVSARLIAGGLPGRTMIATTPASSETWRQEIADRGVDVMILPSAASGGVDLDALLITLGRRDVVSLLIEGGSSVLGSFVDSRLVNKYHIFVAPLVIGGAGALSPVGGTGVGGLTEAACLRPDRVEYLDGDLLVTGYPGTRADMSRCADAAFQDHAASAAGGVPTPTIETGTGDPAVPGTKHAP